MWSQTVVFKENLKTTFKAKNGGGTTKIQRHPKEGMRRVQEATGERGKHLEIPFISKKN